MRICGTLVGLEVLSRVRLGALVYLAFLSAYDEEVLVVPVEVEATPASQSFQV